MSLTKVVCGNVDSASLSLGLSLTEMTRAEGVSPGLSLTKMARDADSETFGTNLSGVVGISNQGRSGMMIVSPLIIRSKAVRESGAQFCLRGITCMNLRQTAGFIYFCLPLNACFSHACTRSIS